MKLQEIYKIKTTAKTFSDDLRDVSEKKTWEIFMMLFEESKGLP